MSGEEWEAGRESAKGERRDMRDERSGENRESEERK